MQDKFKQWLLANGKKKIQHTVMLHLLIIFLNITQKKLMPTYKLYLLFSYFS